LGNHERRLSHATGAPAETKRQPSLIRRSSESGHAVWPPGPARNNLETLIAIKEELAGEKDLAVLPTLRRTLEEKKKRELQ
jgi:hypothetical protein